MLLAILYLPVWFIFVRASPIQTRALAAALSQTYRLQGHRLEVDSTQTDLEFRLFARPGLEGEISTRAVASNTVFLLALLLASPGMNWRNRLTRTALGLVLLFLTQLFFLLTKVEITLIAAQHPLAGSAFFWKSADNFLEITGKVFFPILIWLALALPYLTGSAVDQRGTSSPPAKVGRNAPCPCGSGKKYKHCCGQ